MQRRVAWVVAVPAGLASVAACGHPTAAPRDATFDIAVDAPDAAIDAVDASPFDGMPDLEFVSGEMQTVIVDAEDFSDTDCEVVEHCVNAPGRRILLRFATVAANRGTADLYVGVPPDAGVSNDLFEWSQCHMHHHFRDFASYELLDDTGVVLTGRKQSFCLEDSEPVQHGIASQYTCQRQGITHGWADAYTQFLPCQGIDVTDVPSGTYTLRITVNPHQTLPESNYDNNVFTISVQL